MMPAPTYQIIDEPRAGGLAAWTVRPLWPMFALMFAGPWLAFPWFAFNAAAMGSATRTREWLAAALAIPAFAAAAIGLSLLRIGLDLPTEWMKYLFQGLVVLRLAFGYYLFTLQERSFALHEYHGGPARNGMLLVIAGGFMGRKLVGDLLAGSVFLRLILT